MLIQVFYFTLTWGFGKEKTLFSQGLQLCVFCLLEPVKMKCLTPEVRFSSLINKEVALLTTSNNIRICLLTCVHFSQPLGWWAVLVAGSASARLCVPAHKWNASALKFFKCALRFIVWSEVVTAALAGEHHLCVTQSRDQRCIVYWSYFKNIFVIII